MLTNILNTTIESLRNVWDSLLGRVLLIGLAVGWMPFVLLSMAHNALTTR